MLPVFLWLYSVTAILKIDVRTALLAYTHEFPSKEVLASSPMMHVVHKQRQKPIQVSPSLRATCHCGHHKDRDLKLHFCYSLLHFLLSHLLQRKENRTPFEEGWMRNVCQHLRRYLGNTVTITLLNELSLCVETKPNDKQIQRS